MDAMDAKIQKIRKAAGLKGQTNYQHFDYSASTPLFARRIAYELEFAARLSKINNGKYDLLVNDACDKLIACLDADGALTKSACAGAEEILLPMSGDAKSYTVHMVGHAHIDMNWMWPYQETVSITLETFRTVLQLMREYPDFTYAQSQASTYKIVEEHEPEMLEEIKRRVHEGRWEVSASTWVEADKNMPSEESMVRHLLHTKDYLSRLLDIDPDTLTLDYEPDTFGHSANVPEILTQAGVKYYYHCRGYADHAIYRWHGQSGAEVLVFCEPTWYLGDTNPVFGLYVPQFCQKHGLKDALKVYGVGDHGGGPTRRDLNLIEEMRRWPIYPTLKYSSYRNFYEKLEEKRDSFPVVQQELNCVFTGCYTTQCRVKASNRVGEAALTECETLASGAKLLSGRMPHTAAITESWNHILFSQFHDILTGSGVRDTREFALAAFSRALAQANTERAAAMRAIVEKIDTSCIRESECDMETVSEGAGAGFRANLFQPGCAERGSSRTRIFHLFNPSDHDREETTELTIWDYPGDLHRATARTPDGQTIPFQVLSTGREDYFGHSYTRVLVRLRVPAFGWNTLVFDPCEDKLNELTYPADPRVHTEDVFVLENEYLKARFCSENGALLSLIDKETGEETLRAPAGFFSIDEDTDKGMSSWVVGRYMRREPLSDVRLRWGCRGEMRASLLAEADFSHSHIQCEIRLDKGARRLDIQTNVDWKEVGTRSTFIPQLAFAVPCAGEYKALYDIPAGSLFRKNQALDVPACHFAAAVREQGKTVMLSTDSKYGFRSSDDGLQVTLIRASYEPDPYPERGIHDFKISLSLRPERDAAPLIREAIDAARPLDGLTARPHTGDLPTEGSFLRLEGANLRVTGVKPALDGNGVILRAVNYGEADTAAITLSKAPQAVYLCDALERPIAQLPTDGCKVTFSARAHALIQMRIL